MLLLKRNARNDRTEKVKMILRILVAAMILIQVGIETMVQVIAEVAGKSQAVTCSIA